MEEKSWQISLLEIPLLKAWNKEWKHCLKIVNKILMLNKEEIYFLKDFYGVYSRSVEDK
jgi:hypothetical protein